MLRTALCILLAGSTSVAYAEQSWKRHAVDHSSRGADGVRLADVNADGRPDIATGWEEGGIVRVCLHPGSERASQPWPGVTVGRVASPEDAVLVDLDGDGAVDVVSSCEGRNKTVYIHWAPELSKDYQREEAWTTTAIPATEKQQAWMFALPLDVDGQNGMDLVVGSKGVGAAVGWLQAPADARRLDKWKYHALCPAGWIMSLQSHDMDDDGDQDVLVSDRRGPTRGVFWLENPGADRTRAGDGWSRRMIGADDREVMFLTRGSLEDPARQDVLTAVLGRGISVFEPSSAGLWNTCEIPWPSGCGLGKGVVVGDVDMDGRNDVVITCGSATDGRSGVRWLSRKNGTWSDHEISGGRGVKFDRVELVDLDADGDLDVLSCEERTNLGVIWYENPTR